MTGCQLYESAHIRAVMAPVSAASSVSECPSVRQPEGGSLLQIRVVAGCACFRKQEDRTPVWAPLIC